MKGQDEWLQKCLQSIPLLEHGILNFCDAIGSKTFSTFVKDDFVAILAISLFLLSDQVRTHRAMMWLCFKLKYTERQQEKVSL